MKTKLFILQVLFVTCTLSSFAQKPKPVFSISAGISNAMYFTDDDYGEDNSSDIMVGPMAGVTYRIPFSKGWAVQPGLFYVQKGGVEDLSGYGESVKFKTSLNYLEMPLDIYYSKRNRFFFGFGPSFGLGLSGKMKAEGESEKISFGSGEENDLKSFEVGIDLLGGFQFKNNLFIAVNINTGLNNLATDDTYKYMNGYMGIRLGYVFAGN